MPMIHACEEPGCATLTLGELCLEHEQLHAAETVHPRRFRPHAPAASVVVAAAAVMGALVGARLPHGIRLGSG